MTRVVSRTSHRSVLGHVATLIAVAAAGTGCADSIGDIDRTQPGLIAKKNFLNNRSGKNNYRRNSFRMIWILMWMYLLKTFPY